MKVNEHYLDGKSLFELPFATHDNDASTNQGANLAVWAEAAFGFPPSGSPIHACGGNPSTTTPP
jgi:hypothetical protein